MAGRAVSVAIAVAVLLTACSSDAEPAAQDPTTSTVEPIDFCGEVADFVNDPAVSDVASFSAEFFSSVDERLGRLVDIAPDEVRTALETLRAGFTESDQIFAEFDYDAADPRLPYALDQVDNEAMLAATDDIRRHLTETCGLVGGGEAGPEPGPDQVADIIDAFGVDQALAECLNAELGDVANIPSEELTPELLSRPVCGTSLIVILSEAQTG